MIFTSKASPEILQPSQRLRREESFKGKTFIDIG